MKTDIYDKEYKIECEFYTDVLLKNGVPHNSIICEDQPGHTRDNAFMSRKSTNENGLAIKKEMICCTSVFFKNHRKFTQNR